MRLGLRRLLPAAPFLIAALFISGIAHSGPTDWEGTRPIVPASEAPAPVDLSGPLPNPSPGFPVQGTTVGPDTETAKPNWAPAPASEATSFFCSIHPEPERANTYTDPAFSTPG